MTAEQAISAVTKQSGALSSVLSEVKQEVLERRRGGSTSCQVLHSKPAGGIGGIVHVTRDHAHLALPYDDR